jgi:hypothetical protein
MALKSESSVQIVWFINTNAFFCRADNQPEFMQNLGFVTDSGIPELYSFSGQIEPFLLAQTQQLPSNGPSPALRRESQPLNISAAPKR